MDTFFLQSPTDWHSHFDIDADISPWGAEAGAAVTHSRYTDDPDHDSCYRVVSDTDSKGVYIVLPDIRPETKYVFEVAYKNGSGQEIDYLVWDETNGAAIQSGTLTETIWSNLYFEFTTAAACVGVAIYLRAGTASGVEFLIDDILLQGNAFARTPDSIQLSHDAITRNHVVEGGKKIKDATAPFQNFSISYKHLYNPQFTQIRKMSISNKRGWYNDYAVPDGEDTGVLYPEGDYELDGIVSVPSSTHVASHVTSIEYPNAVGDFGVAAGATEFTAAEYAKLADDANYIETTVGYQSRMAYHKFLIDVSADFSVIETIQSFSIVYKGAAGDLSTKAASGIRLYVWNGATWWEIAETITPDKQIIAYSTTLPAEAQDYVDIANGYVYILAATQAGKESSGALSLKSYYISVKINEDMGSKVALRNKAVLTAGDVIEVRNLTDNAVLTLATDYTIADDRESVIVSGEDAGDTIRVKYKQYYPVTLERLNERRLPLTEAAAPKRSASFMLATTTGFE